MKRTDEPGLTVISLIRGRRSTVAAATGLMIVAAAVPAASVLLLQRAVRRMGSGESVTVETVGFVALYATSAIVSVARTWVTKDAAFAVVSDLRRRLYRHWLRCAPERRGLTGDVVSRLTNDVDEVQYGVSAAVTAIRNPLTLLGLAAVAVASAPRLAALAALGAPALWWVARWGADRVRLSASAFQARRSALCAAVVEQMAGAGVIREFGVGARFEDEFQSVDARDRTARVRMEVLRVLPSAITRFATASGVAFLLAVGAGQVSGGELAAADLVAFIGAAVLMIGPVGGLSEVWSLMRRSTAALRRIQRALDQPVIAESTGEPASPLSGPLGLTFADVTAGYDGEPVLHNAEIDVKAGSFVAIVGPTGAGKTTILRLLSRSLRPRQGHVVLGGAALEDVEEADLRRAVAVVGQTPFLFARTVVENVVLGRAWISDAERDAAAREAGVLARIERLPLGWKSSVSEMGASLSGGERQRVCLARALAGGPRLLLLDEPTAHVDDGTRDAILSSIQGLRGRCTVILVTHDPEVAMKADRVVGVVDGKLVDLVDDMAVAP